MNDLRISLIQSALHWEDPAANRGMFDETMAPLQGRTDLVVLPEMFSTGFSMNAPALAEAMDGSSVAWMRKQAAALGAVVAGSLIIQENGAYYNRLVWMRPDGTYDTYDKRHLFSLANEHLTYTAGERKLIVPVKGWKVCPLICYDLRFPVWSRNVEDYDLLIYTANFPARRRYAWRQLLRARAIENQCFVAAVNIVGKDGKGIAYSGDSCVIDPYGKLAKEATDRATVINMKLDYSELEDIREKLPFLKDRDGFEIQPM